MRRGLVLFAGALLPLLFGASPANADMRADLLVTALLELDDHGDRFLRQAEGSGAGAPSFFLNQSVASVAQISGVELSPSLLSVSLDALENSRYGSFSSFFAFSPARTLWMDRAGPTVGLPRAVNDYGLDGQGTVIGIVDTGADVAHPALRNPDGTTRIRYMLAFGKDPRGVHPTLEDAYGCTGDDPCAVYDADDIDQILSSGILGGLPKDRIGHGTHITSLAAGRDKKYGGIAPASDLIVVAASTVDGGVTDARILLGTRFVFERAKALDLPAVVNVSLGSNFGAHDGTSSVEQGLRELARGPGRAVVVAAGNSGQLHDNVHPDYPGPFGSFAEYSVTTGANVTVPIVTTGSGSGSSQGAIFLWISTKPGDDLSVSFVAGERGATTFVGPESAGGISSTAWNDKDDFDVVIVNGISGDFEADIQKGSVVVAVAGTFEPGRVFEIVLRGRASARMWSSGTGSQSPLQSGLGPVLARAARFGTVAIPGSDPELITIGASENRSSWVDYTGQEIGFSDVAKGLSSFSSAGPNQLGGLKPELIAPGNGLIGAMSNSADPRKALGNSSQFASAGACPGSTECFVVDDEHGVASGTSMAAPIATGAIALLMQRDPSLTMEKAKRFLMAGATRLQTDDQGSLAGTGELNIEGALLAQDAAETSSTTAPDPNTSHVVWADRYVRPGASLTGYLILRDATSSPTVSDEVRVDVDGPGSASFKELTPGLYEITLRTKADAGGQSLKVSTWMGNQLVKSTNLAVALDPLQAEFGYEVTGGTCTISGAPRPSTTHLWLLSVLGFFWLARRRAAQKFPA